MRTPATLALSAAIALALAGTAHAGNKAKSSQPEQAQEQAVTLKIEDAAVYNPDQFPVAQNSVPTSAKPVPAATAPLKPIDPPKAPDANKASVPVKPIAPPKPADPGQTAKTWTTDGDWLRLALNAWADQANWHIEWVDGTGAPLPEEWDRRLRVPLHFDGSFPDAVKQCIELYASHGDHLVYDSFPPSRVIVITETN